MFSTPYHLRLKDNQMIVSTKECHDVYKSIPIEDIGIVVLEHLQSTITLPLLNALSENNVAVVLCNGNYMPSAMLMNLDSNKIQAENYRAQIEAGEPLKKNLWQQIVKAKIRNQAGLLNKLGKDGDKLRPYYCNVKSGDADNREGVAAKVYWRELFGEHFVREREGAPPNNLLNYGYYILRAATARSLMGSGLFPAFGIFHRNRYNAFPLADDVMEVYRPYVDEVVYSLYNAGSIQLNKETKMKLLNVLFSDTLFGSIKRPLSIALSFTTASFAKCFVKEQKVISCPIFK